jgi:peptidoglycan/xylan/chitin deacetylase (PgdA/CDA1 family)
MNRTLNFHQVKNGRWFDNVICWLKSRYTVTSADFLEGKSGKSVPGNTCQLTFDDGDISFYNIILPVLRKHKIPATLFVSPKICRDRSNYWFQEINAFDRFGLKKAISSITGIPLASLVKVSAESVLKSMPVHSITEVIHESRRTLPYSLIPFQNINILQLKEIDSSGLVTIGAHTMNHPILKNESDDQSNYEIARSVSLLSEILDHEIRYFAYPNGIPDIDYTEREKKYLAGSGTILCFKNEAATSGINDLLTLPRIAISNNESNLLIDLKLKIGGIWNTLKKMNPEGEYSERKKSSRLMKLKLN